MTVLSALPSPPTVARCVRFTVRGRPAPQGSKRIMPSGRPGGRVHVVESSRHVLPWRSDVASAALDKDLPFADELPFSGPVGVRLVFRLPRPRSHYGTGRNADRLKPSAPTIPTTRPDLDKLARSVLDALSGVVWADDALIAVLDVTKRYASPQQPPGATVECCEIGSPAQ